MSVKSFLSMVGLGAIAFAAAPAIAQEAADAGDAPQTAQEIVVPGKIAYRDRALETAPVLSYGLDYFQRFEPLTVGDALKRVPSVAFLSDVLESDGVRLRGLDPAYTQILINGEKVPGAGSGSGTDDAGADTAFFVDRIPAELIERVEVVRSASANRSGDAVAGAINIVLRDAYALEGGYVRAGVLYFANDGHWGETLGGVYGGKVGEGRLLIGANLQDRHNPKDKFSSRYPSPSDALYNIEDQTDVRDGTDYSANFSYETPLAGGELSLDGFFVRTERTQNEDSIEYLNLPATPLRSETSLFTLNDNDVNIEQESFSLVGEYEFDLLGGETSIQIGYAAFDNKEVEFEDDAEFRRGSDVIPFPELDRYTRDDIDLTVRDVERTIELEHSREFGSYELEIGVDFETKERDDKLLENRSRTTFSNNTVLTRTARPPAGTTLNLPFVNDQSDTSVERERLDPYVVLSKENGALAWEAGVRFENTTVEVIDRINALGETFETDTSEVLPSVHVKYSLTENDRLSFSVARTVRNPSLFYLAPFELQEEIGDNDFIGNPKLDQEKAWGLDVGYERRLGRTGVAGVNVFYRDVQDLIEVASTGEEGSAGAGTLVLQPQNVGDGVVYGIEFDLSTPLTVVGLENTGVFVNYSWLDSEVDDAFGSRRFNNQAEYVFNLGFIHDLPAFGAAFGATYRKQGDAESRIFLEEVSTKYGADLEVFIEKRIGDSFTLRLTGSNLLDESKDEVFDSFASPEDQRARVYDGDDAFETETESAGPVFQLIGRYAF